MANQSRCPICGNLGVLSSPEISDTEFRCVNKHFEYGEYKYSSVEELEREKILLSGTYDDLMEVILHAHQKNPREYYTKFLFSDKATVIKNNSGEAWFYKCNALVQIEMLKPQPTPFADAEKIFEAGKFAIIYSDETEMRYTKAGVYYLLLATAIGLLTYVRTDMNMSLDGEMRIRNKSLNKRNFYVEDKYHREFLFHKIRLALEIKEFVPIDFVKSDPELFEQFSIFPMLFLECVISEKNRYERYYSQSFTEQQIIEKENIFIKFKENIPESPGTSISKIRKVLTQKTNISTTSQGIGCSTLVISIILAFLIHIVI